MNSSGPPRKGRPLCRCGKIHDDVAPDMVDSMERLAKAMLADALRTRTPGEPMICVCADHTYFMDDVDSCCHDCGAAIYHRPWQPFEARKVCIPCVSSRPEYKDFRKKWPQPTPTRPSKFTRH